MKRDMFSKNIDKILELIKSRTYTSMQINTLRNELKEKGYISQSMTHEQFVKRLNEYQVKKIDISINDGYLSVFTYDKEVSESKMLLGCKKNSFFSMSTALNLQGLSNYRKNFIFISKELSAKHTDEQRKPLLQDSIGLAFKKDYRRTQMVGKYQEKHVVFLSPKNTGNFEVLTSDDGLRMSSINRSLVEMIVNVQYFINSLNIINTFIPIKNELDVDIVFDIVKKFDFIYPYYQCVGFFLEQIGFSKKELLKFKNEIGELNFYTDKNVEEYEYDTYWKMYHIISFTSAM